MKKPAVIASAFALACGLSAFAGSATWFDAKISTYTDAAAWNTTEGITGGTWAEGALDAATLDTTGGADAAKLVVDADETAPLKFNATNGRAPADGAVTVNSTITFNAFESTSLPDVPDGAKAGIIAVKTGDTTYAFYGLVKVDDANAWQPLAGVTPTAATLSNVPVAVTVAQVPDSDPVAYTVTYAINGTALTYGGQTAIPVIAGEITAASYSGCGEVSALSSKYYVPTGTFDLGDFSTSETFVIDSVVNMTTGEAITIAEGGSVELPAGTVVRVNFAIKPGVQKDFTGDAFVERTVIKENNVGVEVDSEDLPVVDDANAKIGSVYYLTLAKAVFNATNGDTVELLGDEVGTNMDVTASCTIDLGNFTYTYAYATSGQIDVSGGCTVTIQNGTIKNGKNGDEVVRQGGCLIRSYATKLTIKDITLDATGVQSMSDRYPTEEDPKARDNYLGVIAATSGDLEISGSTTVINTAAGVNAISFGNYAGGSYTMGTLTIDTTGSIAGDVLLTGGAIAAYSDKVSGHYYIGANAQTVFASAPASFGAMIGEFASVTTAVAYVINKTGEIFKDFAAANAAAVATDTVTLLANVSLSAATAFNGATLVPGANTITLADAAASLTYKDNSLLASFDTTVDGKEVQYVNGAYVVADPAPAGFIFTLTATGINGTPTYTIGVGGVAIPFVAGDGVWTTGLLPVGATFTVAYGTTVKVPVATWSDPVNVTDQGKGVFTMGSAAASATLTITDAGSGTPTEEQAAEAIAQGADAALTDPTARAAFDTNIAGIQKTALASWLSGNTKVTYADIAAAADPADVKVSCELGAEQVVADPTLTLTSLESTENAGEFTIKVKLTSGSSTDAIAYATAAVKELFQATYSLGTPAWSGDNVTAVPVPESGAEAAFTVAPADTTKPAAFIRIAK